MFSNWRMDGFPQRDAQDCTAPSIAVNAAFSNFARDGVEVFGLCHR